MTPSASVTLGASAPPDSAHERLLQALFRFREGDANMRSVWLCTRNDVIANLAVLVAAAGVFGTGTVWPDVAVAAMLALLGLSSGRIVIRQARAELST